jgi:hypothetical protein
MGSQAWKELEVTVLSAQDLKNVKLTGGTMNPYCVAWIYPHTKVAGPVNNGGGVNPTWNATIKLPVEESLLEQGNASLTIEIYNHGRFSNKFVGSALVPLADIKSLQSRGSSYQVRTKSGKNKGQINVAVKVGRMLTEEEVAKNAPPVTAYPAMASGMGGMGGMGAGQYSQQPYYPPQQYPQQNPQQYYVYQQARPRRSGMMGGPGLGLGAGLLGGMLLGGALDGGFDGGGCGGGCGG